MSKAGMPILAGAMLLGSRGAAVATTHDAKSMDMAGNMVEGVMHMTPDARAPIGVIGDHTLKQGAVGLAYQYMRMDMDDNRSGTDTLEDAEVLSQFPVTPTRMTMDMQMVSLMYGWSENFSLMAMGSYTDSEMDHINRAGVRFTTRSKGFGDVKLSGVYRLYRSGNHDLLLNAGVSLPTGSIDEKDATPAGPNQQLPYSMQLGSGTFDLLPGLTYRGRADAFSWGAQVGGTIRLGRNDNGYSQGDRYRITAWAARGWADWISTSLRVNLEGVGNIDGADPLLNPALVPTADPKRRGGTSVDILGGVNLMATDGLLEGSRLFLEFGVPVYQNLDGPQLATDWRFTIGAQVRF